MQRLTIVGVGHGDPELITLKAKRVLEEAPMLHGWGGDQQGSAG